MASFRTAQPCEQPAAPRETPPLSVWSKGALLAGSRDPRRPRASRPVSERAALHFHKRLIWMGSLSIVEAGWRARP